MTSYEEIRKNKRLTQFNDIRDYVVQNSVKIEEPKKEKKKEEDQSLLFFSEEK